jgi:D-tyrosyl-tRNA(Tyr) deacylase
MASKVLKVKLWDGEDGKKWKCNVSDIEGEILCGAFLLVMFIRLISRHANHHGACH